VAASSSRRLKARAPPAPARRDRAVLSLDPLPETDETQALGRRVNVRRTSGSGGEEQSVRGEKSQTTAKERMICGSLKKKKEKITKASEKRERRRSDNNLDLAFVLKKGRRRCKAGSTGRHVGALFSAAFEFRVRSRKSYLDFK